jgi:hypothetical protein
MHQQLKGPLFHLKGPVLKELLFHRKKGPLKELLYHHHPPMEPLYPLLLPQSPSPLLCQTLAAAQ